MSAGITFNFDFKKVSSEKFENLVENLLIGILAFNGIHL